MKEIEKYDKTMKDKLESLFELIEGSNIKDYEAILFNIYEDRKYYTIEACFDDNNIIGRNTPFVIGDNTVPWDMIERDIEMILRSRIKEKKDVYSQFKTIAYGFVNGDLHYIRKSQKQNKKQVHYTADDFKDFESHKLAAWLGVYLTDEAKKKYSFNMVNMMFKEFSEEEHKYWSKILAENFDYDKREKLCE